MADNTLKFAQTSPKTNIRSIHSNPPQFARTQTMFQFKPPLVIPITPKKPYWGNLFPKNFRVGNTPIRYVFFKSPTIKPMRLAQPILRFPKIASWLFFHL